jgi:hypothetical protein
MNFTILDDCPMLVSSFRIRLIWISLGVSYHGFLIPGSSRITTPELPVDLSSTTRSLRRTSALR